MHQNQLFNRTRWRLAGWYAGVMGVILSFCGMAFYEMMAQAHWQALHRELESIAGTLHDGLEPALTQPGHIEPSVEQALPGLCLAGANCSKQPEALQRHILGAVQQDGYYARFLTQSGQLVATVGHQPSALPIQLSPNELWQTLDDQAGNHYHQISLLLKTANHSPWGYLQVGRSLQEFDRHLATTRLVLLLGLPVAMLLICGASWALAGIAMQPVYQSYQRMQQFTTDAAHELRTPIAATRATVESALELDEFPSEAVPILRTIERQNSRLTQLVQDLLLLSWMDLQVVSVAYRSCCLNRLIEDLVDEFEALAIAANLSLTVSIQVDYPLLVLGDEEQLYRLLANLITNAIQYTPTGGKITVVLEQTDQQGLVHIQDTGIGIAPEDQARIFARFYCVTGDRSRQTGGAGLGLAIAQAIAQSHQGKLEVTSAVGQGSRFTLHLPLNSSKTQRVA